jgi:spore germination cell wall hydrolase CwlJ-like protein
MQQVSTHLLVRVLLGWVIALAILGYAVTKVEKPLQKVEAVQEEPEKVAKVVDHKQLQCLADNIYFEAGGESTEGKAAVARVVLNRIQHGYGSTPCQVVYQSKTVKQVNDDDETLWVKACQFAWVCEGKKNPNRQSARYQNSLRVAQDVLLYDMYKEVIPMSVLFFHNLSVQPAITYGFVKQIGNHIFYSKPHKKKQR